MPNRQSRVGALWAVVIALALPAIPLGAQDAPAPSCEGPEHRQFDFWVGTWEVSTDRGIAGTNRITTTLDGCVLHEHWTGAQGGTGESFNVFDRRTGRWHQLWVDNRGGVLRFTGTYAEGVLAMAGESLGPEGHTVLHRLTFFNQPADTTVRQLWEQSRDGGTTWAVVFDGLYRRKP